MRIYKLAHVYSKHKKVCESLLKPENLDPGNKPPKVWECPDLRFWFRPLQCVDSDSGSDFRLSQCPGAFGSRRLVRACLFAPELNFKSAKEKKNEKKKPKAGEFCMVWDLLVDNFVQISSAHLSSYREIQPCAGGHKRA